MNIHSVIFRRSVFVGLLLGLLMIVGIVQAQFDANAPPAPGNLYAAPIFSFISCCGIHGEYQGVELAWQGSNDTSLVLGYKIYRDGIYLGDAYGGFYYWDYGANGYTNYSYDVVAFNRGNFATSTTNILTPLGKNALVSAISKATVYDQPDKPRKNLGFQPKGARGTIVSGPRYVISGPSHRFVVTYYYFTDFDSGVDGWVEETDLHGLPAMGISVDSANVFGKVRERLHTLLSKIRDSRDAFTAAILQR